MYESYNGRDFAGNPYALFLHLLDREEYSHLEHIIVVPFLSHPKVKKFRNYSNVRLVRINSAAYVRYAETAAFFINNSSYKPYLIKRPGQIYVYTWHSTLLKKLAADKGAPWEAKNVTRALISADYFISPNRFTTDILLHSHGAAAFMNGQIAEFGYPRNDLTVNGDAASFKRRLGFSEKETLILFAPTWRGEQDAVDSVAPTLDQYRRLKEKLPENYRIIIKFHTMVYRFLKRDTLRFCAPMDMDTNELLCAADILLTDYSGIFFDFLITGKPIVFFTPDRTSYAQAKSGFYLDLDTLPGPVCDDIDSAAAAILNIKEVSLSYSETYAQFQRRFVGDDDGQACRRTVDLVFAEKIDSRVYRLPHERRKVLFFPGPFNPNGVTTSFIALLGTIDYSKWDVAVLLPDDSVNRTFQSLIDRRAHIFYQCSPDAFTRSEYQRHVRFLRNGSFKNDDLPIEAYRRSVERIFYGTQFDIVVNFHGYQPSDAAKMIFGVSAGRKLIFLHNDLERDRGIKQPQLHAVFSLYKYYDSLFCVSEDSLKSNIAGMAQYVKSVFNDDVTEKMDFVQNLINPDRILTLAQEPLIDNVAAMLRDGCNFITIGRLSPEKNQRRLIDAFSIVHEEYPDTRLYIIGDGKLSSVLRKQASKLGLDACIVFIPFLQNPYPLLSACDCFVLSSDIEGQPITILEALTLNKPIIATDISGPHDMLKGGEGMLVPVSADALSQAMITFIRDGKKMERKHFDPYGYVSAAKMRFAEKVLEDTK